MTQITRAIVGALDARFYPEHGANWDDTLLCRQVLRWSAHASRVLDLGAGAGIVRQLDLRGTNAIVHGCDLDPRVATNPLIHYGCRADAEALPYRSDSFDAVVADNVLEHLVRPERVFAEVFRVLRPGGLFHFKTPNRRHYVPTVARITPHWVHTKLTSLRGRAGFDTFETHYKVNTAKEIKRIAQRTGFEILESLMVEGRPEYCRIHPALYLCGIVYERLVNSSTLFAALRVIVLGVLKKPRVLSAPLHRQ